MKAWPKELLRAALPLALSAMVADAGTAAAQQSKPNVILLVSDDTGYGDLGAYGGPITISQYERLQSVREMLATEGIEIPLPTGN